MEGVADVSERQDPSDAVSFQSFNVQLFVVGLPSCCKLWMRIDGGNPGQVRYARRVNGICILHTWEPRARRAIYAERSAVLFRMIA
jgi:hypothetical protein